MAVKLGQAAFDALVLGLSSALAEHSRTWRAASQALLARKLPVTCPFLSSDFALNYRDDDAATMKDEIQLNRRTEAGCQSIRIRCRTVSGAFDQGDRPQQLRIRVVAPPGGRAIRLPIGRK